MHSSPLLRIALRLIPLWVFVVASAHLEAQTTRPGASARSGAATTRSSSGRTGTSSSSRSSNGQRTYRSNTELGDAMITIDPETRSLVIVTDEDTHKEMLNVIKTLDKPKPQVLIKVIFLEITYNKGYDVGVEGSYTFNLQNPVAATSSTKTTTTTNLATASAGNTSQTVTALNETLTTAASLGKLITPGTNFGLSALTDGLVVRAISDDWSATLRAISSKGKVEILSRPSIMARNNQEAVIVVGQEVPFITNSRTDALGQITNTIQYDNVGIILRVTPFITSEGSVEMIVAPEISSLNNVQTVPISNTVRAPTIDKRSAETVVVTPSGKTVVIGGLMATTRTESVDKVPILGDIPILGLPFRHTVKKDEKRELMIFLTPTIVNSPESIDRVNAEEVNKSELTHRTASEADLTRFSSDLPPLPEPEPMLEPPPVRRPTAVRETSAPKAPSANTIPTSKPATIVPKPTPRPRPITR